VTLQSYWAQYDATLARVRAEKPDTFAALKAILDAFSPPSSGDAFFPGGADDTLGDALNDAGWAVEWSEGDYLWRARHPRTGAMLEHVEGDLYEQHPLTERTRCTLCGKELVPGCCPTVGADLPQSMTVAELRALLEEWPASASVTFGDTLGRPPQYVDGDPVAVEGVALPDGLYIGWLTDAQRTALGWEVQS
jgi:hypothetical protein